MTETHYDNEQTSDTPEPKSVPAHQRMPVARQLTILGLILVGILSVSAVPKIMAGLTDTNIQPANVPGTPSEQTTETDDTDPDPFASISITGKAAFVWDVNKQRVLYEKNPDTQLPIASITKLMTALVAHELVSEQTDISIPEHAVLQDGESGFVEGESFTLDTLTDLTLMSSINDGAFAIATAAGALLDQSEPTRTFVEAMNIRADELKLTQTYFRNPTGLDISETEAGAYGSARDIAFLMEHMLTETPELLEATTESDSTYYNAAGAYHEAENTNYTVNEIPGILGSKTGYTTLAGGNLVVAFDAGLNRPVIVVVLGSSYNGRFDDVLSLTAAARDAL